MREQVFKSLGTTTIYRTMSPFSLIIISKNSFTGGLNKCEVMLQNDLTMQKCFRQKLCRFSRIQGEVIVINKVNIQKNYNIRMPEKKLLKRQKFSFLLSNFPLTLKDFSVNNHLQYQVLKWRVFS